MHGPGRRKSAASTKLAAVNGDLSFARPAVVVGHFLGDSIAGAEAQLDFTLGGALRRRYALGLYPGSVGSAAYVPSLGGNGAAGVVVGLGDIGSLGIGTIRTALLAGLLELGVSDPDCPDGVALVLLGSRAGAVGVAESVAAMLDAIAEAERRLGAQRLKPLGEVQLLSAYEDEAHRLWHTLRRLVAEPRYARLFTLEDEIVYAPGAQKRLVRGDDPSAWQAIQIVADEAGGDDAGFRYTVAGDRARADGFLVGANRDFLTRFLATAKNRKLDAAPTRALFQLIWPPEMKQSSQDDRNVRLILDDAAAALPFELMDDRPAEGDDSAMLPPAVRRGMVRQLIDRRFARLQATPGGGLRALVVGDPRGGPAAADFAELPGARAEAEAVADLLREAGFEVVALIGDDVTPDQVVERFLQGGWTVVHISAHGAYDYAFRSDRDAAKAAGWDGVRDHYTGPRHTGIVLGDKLMLSPSILQAMPEPPVLAFLNCCFLGTVKAEDEEKLRASGRPEFAASFAGELIALGTRAVVAAGWEVSDQGALVFARSLYAGLLGEAQPFGEAVRNARGAVYEADAGDATWGAYQCYGEPDWRLRADGDAPARQRGAAVFASPAEAAARVEGIGNLAQVGGERPHVRARLTHELETIARAVEARGWTAREGVAERIGDAFTALGEEEQAIKWFEAALTQNAAPSLRLIEMLARLRLRQAFRAGPERPGETPTASLERIELIREQLTFLCTVAGATAERLSLIGKAADRAAQLTLGDARDTELGRMRDAYRQAWKLARAEATADPRKPGLMAVTAGVLIALRSGGDPQEYRAELDDLAADFAAHPALDASWTAAAEMARQVLAALIDQGVSPQRAQALVDQFRSAWSRAAAGDDQASLLEPIRTIASVLAEKDGTRAAAEWAASIESAVAEAPAKS